MYVDGVKVGTTTGGQATPHLLVSRLCEGETSESDGSASSVLGWRQALPPLLPGRHEVSPPSTSCCSPSLSRCSCCPASSCAGRPQGLSPAAQARQAWQQLPLLRPTVQRQHCVRQSALRENISPTSSHNLLS